MGRYRIRLMDKTTLTGLMNINEYDDAKPTIEVRSVIVEGSSIEHIKINRDNIAYVYPA